MARRTITPADRVRAAGRRHAYWAATYLTAPRLEGERAFWARQTGPEATARARMMRAMATRHAARVERYRARLAAAGSARAARTR